MRKNILVLIVLSLFFGSLIASAGDVKETKTVSNFNRIQISGSQKIFITQSNENSVTVLTNEDNMKNIVVSVNDGELVVKDSNSNSSWWKRIFNSAKKVTVYINAKSISQIIASGAQSIDIKEIDNDNLNLEILGAGKVEITGKTDNFSAKVSGTAKISAKDFRAKNADINLSGAGKVEVYASDKLKLSLSGVGKIVYFGNPKIIEPEISGLGKISNGEK